MRLNVGGRGARQSQGPEVMVITRNKATNSVMLAGN